MTRETFIIELNKLGINPTHEQLESLSIYKDMLVEYNKKFNLTAILDEKEIYLKHFYDSLTITKVVDLNEELKVLDIGTGAGFPGLVLKIFFPNLEVTLLDSNNKKIMFLNTVIEKLHLTKIECICARAEELPATKRESYDIVTSRAVAHLRVLIELSISYLKVEGYFIAMKGNAKEEIKESINTMNKLFCTIESKENFLLPDNISNRTIIKIKKEEPTPLCYPRKYDQIKKSEIK